MVQFKITVKNMDKLKKIRYWHDDNFKVIRRFGLGLLIAAVIAFILRYLILKYVNSSEIYGLLLYILIVTFLVSAFGCRLVGDKYCMTYVDTNNRERLQLDGNFLIQTRQLAAGLGYMNDTPSGRDYTDVIDLSTLTEARFDPGSKRIELDVCLYQKGNAYIDENTLMQKKKVFYDYYEPSLKATLEQQGVNFKEQKITYKLMSQPVEDFYA